MKVLVILTGGTIGSSFLEGFIALDKDIKSKLLDGYTDISIDTVHPYTILSEQLNGKYLNTLISCVQKNIDKDYDGIIITHGTDTLQYTACGLSCAFGDSEIPIVLVSSNYVLDDKRANGKDNFKYAVEFIKEKIGGVFVSYKNTGKKPEIHQGHKVLPHEIYTDDVKSIGGAFGYFQKEKFIQNYAREKCEAFEQISLNETSPVLWLRIHPGMIFPNATGYKAILLEGYHSGTLPTLSPEFRTFCLTANAPLFLIGAKNGAQYESTKEFQELGIKPLPQISPVYAYMKLWITVDNQTL